jgi:hypothetical protein
MRPYPIADTANLKASSVCGGYASQNQQMPTTGPINAAGIVAAILASVQLMKGAMAGAGGLAADAVKA